MYMVKYFVSRLMIFHEPDVSEKKPENVLG